MKGLRIRYEEEDFTNGWRVFGLRVNYALKTGTSKGIIGRCQTIISIFSLVG